MPLLDFPNSPTSGDIYVAPNGVTYTYDTSLGPVGVWIAAPTAPLSVTAGSITGTASIGSTLTYVPGVASGGAPPYSYIYQWKANNLPISGATGLNYVVQPGDAGKTLTVTITATDSSTPTDSVSATTSPVFINSALTIDNVGTISGTPEVGSTLTYTVGSASGGTGAINLTWVWRKASDNSQLQVGGTTYPLGSSLVGQQVYVQLTATDSATPTPAVATANTGNYPSSPATIIYPPLSITNPGSITGTAQIGSTLTYTVGTSTGGFGTVNLTWVWRKESDNSQLQLGGTTYIVAAGLAGDRVYVALTATDSATPTPQVATDNTGFYPTPPSTIAKAPFPVPVWNPLPANGLDTIPGGQSGLYNGTATSITATGCIEAAVATPPTVPSAYSTGSQPIAVGQTLAVRWSLSALCGGAASDTPITGTVTDGTYEKVYNITVQRQPSSFSFTPVTSAPLNTVEQSTIANITNINTTAYVTYGPGTTTGITSSLEANISGGGWQPIPAAGAFGTGLQIQNGQTLQVRFNTGSGVGATNVAEIYVGDGNTSKYTAAQFQVANTTTPAFPGLTFGPAPQPTASPANTNLSTPSLYGTVSATWPNLPSNPITVTSTGNLEFRNVTTAGSFGQGAQVFNTGNVIEIRWNAAAASAALDTAVLTGNLTGGGYTSTYSLTVAKLPGAYNWGNLSGEGTTSTVTSSQITISDINTPAQLTYAPDPTNPLTAVQASINGGVFTNVPTSGNPGLVINPAGSTGLLPTTVIIKGLTGPTGGVTYSITTEIGDGASSTAQIWNVATTAVPNAITTPTITAPTGTTNNPNAFSPAGLTVTGSAYSVASGSPGAHLNSDWQVVANTGSTTITRNPETSQIVTVGTPAVSFSSITGTITGVFSGSQTVFGGTYNSGRFVIVGGGGKIATSTDGGVSWTDGSSGGSQWNVAAYGAGLFVVGGASGIITSINGTSWTTRALASLGIGGITALAFGNGVFIAGSNTGQVYVSGDGITWNLQGATPFGGNPFTDIAFGGGVFMAVCSGSTAKAARTTDGITWTDTTVGFTPLGIAYGNSKFVASTSSGNVYTNTGATVGGWSAAIATGLASGTLGFIKYLGGYFYFANNGTSWAASSNGNSGTWSVITGPPTFNNAYAGVEGGGVILIGGGGPFLSKTAGFTTTLTLTDTTDLANMQIGDTVVEVDGGADASGVITAINTGTPSITLASVTGTWDVNSKALDTSRTISVTTPNPPLISTNTISLVTPQSKSWAQGTSPTNGVSVPTVNNQSFTNIVYGNGVFVATVRTSTGVTVYTSATGATWTAGSSFTNNFTGLVFTNGKFVMYGTGGAPQFRNSTDGVNWSALYTGTNFPGSDFIFVTSNGTMINGKSLAPGSGMNVRRSTDYGANWVSSTFNYPTTTSGVLYAAGDGAGNWLGSIQNLAGNAFDYYNSTDDGVTWTYAATVSANPPTEAGYAGSGNYLFGNSTTTYVRTLSSAAGSSNSYRGPFVFAGSKIYAISTLSANQIVSVSSASPTGPATTEFSGSASVSYTTGAVSSNGNNVVWGGFEPGVQQTYNAYISVPDSTVLSILGANTDGFAVGNLISNGVAGASTASGTIYAINGTSVTVVPPSANWTAGQNLYRGETIVNDLADASNLVSYFIAKALLATSTTYFARTRYHSATTDSAWSNWATFGTAATWPITPGMPMGGGFFGGQIRVFAGEDGGGLPATTTIYNLIVAPSSGGFNSMVAYSTSGSVGTAPADNKVYGRTATLAFNNGSYPAFQWAAGLTIGGFNDWYIPAVYELQIIYTILKPGATTNVTSNQPNPNAIPPITAYGFFTDPSQTTATAFQFPSGTEKFNYTGSEQYWTSTEDLVNALGRVETIEFSGGNITTTFKTTNQVARAIRRIPA